MYYFLTPILAVVISLYVLTAEMIAMRIMIMSQF